MVAHRSFPDILICFGGSNSITENKSCHFCPLHIAGPFHLIFKKYFAKYPTLNHSGLLISHCFEKTMVFNNKSSQFILWRRQWHPTPVLLPGKSHGWRSLVGCRPWGREESDTTERLHFHFFLSCIGEGNGNPLQCSWLENPRDGGAWWAAVYGVAQSRTRLKRLSSSSSLSYNSNNDTSFIFLLGYNSNNLICSALIIPPNLSCTILKACVFQNKDLICLIEDTHISIWFFFFYKYLMVKNIQFC